MQLLSEVSSFSRLYQIRAARVALLLALAALPLPLVGLALFRYQRYDLAFLLYHGLCLGAFAMLGHRRLTTGRSLAPVLLAAFVLGMVATAVVGAVVDASRLRAVMAHYGFVAWQLPLLGAYFVVINPAVEEAFWRGTIFERLSHDLPAAWAGALSSLLFGAWHALVLSTILPTLWIPATLVIVLFGASMVLVYHHSERHLAPCTLLHAVGGDLPLLVVLGVAFLHVH